MLKVSIVSLIYQSARLADWVHESVHNFTPMIARGQAEFFFVWRTTRHTDSWRTFANAAISTS